MAPVALNDAVFLLVEKREQPMHVGGLQIYRLPEGAGPDWLTARYEEMLEAGPAALAPMFRRRARRSPAALGAWTWQEDASVDLEHHLRHSALPRPGRVRELLALASRLHGTLLDRHRPLWEAHLIEGLEGDRFAVYSKVHHSVLDGVSALRLLAESLSPDPEQSDMPMPWFRGPSPGSTPAGQGHQSLPGIPVALLRSAMEMTGVASRASVDALRAAFDPARRTPRLAPRTILNRPITGSRRFAAQSWPLERFRSVASASSTTVNDVLLAVCGGALRSYLLEMQALPDEPLIAMTPVSLRAEGAAAGGNAVGALLCDLGTDRADAAERLDIVHESMSSGKRLLRGLSPGQAALAGALVTAPMLLGQVPGLRRVASPGYNLVISNVPGPQGPLYWNGASLLGSYPLSIPTDGQALNITVTGYGPNLEFGLTGCRSTVPRLQRLLGHLEDSLADLEAAVRP